MTAWLPVRAEAVPAELRALGWLLWRAEVRGPGKPTKVPYRIAKPAEKASSTDPATWGTFEEALSVYEGRAELPGGAVHGIGVALTVESGITCIDLDHVVGTEGQLDPRAGTIVERCDSWTERSPSDTGLHIFVRGTVPQGLRAPQIEVYSSGRYIAITGHQWPGTPGELKPQQAYLDYLVRLEAGARAPRRTYTGPTMPPPDDLAGALLAKLQGWGVPVLRLKPWSDGFLVELTTCPWADEHTTGQGGAVVMIHASGAFDFTCLHAHCGGRTWRDFRALMETQR